MAVLSTFTLAILYLNTVLLNTALAQNYVLSQSYAGEALLDNFDFFTSPDPSGGWVTYVDRPTAENKSYVVIGGAVVYIGVDTATVLDPTGPGREAVRIVSNASFQYGLFMADFNHAPGGICSLWPSWWMVGPDWPNNGEFDIVEGVNLNVANIISAHATANCTLTGQNQLGMVLSDDCNSGESTTDPTNGCSTQSASNTSFGDAFNSIGGGVYSMLWTNESISVWFFPRGSIPDDVLNQTPDPTTWGTPDALVSAPDCPIDNHFQNMQMVLDTDFCGGWASGLWQSSGCNALNDTCVGFVAANPAAFGNAFWAINYINVYQLQTNAGDPSDGGSSEQHPINIPPISSEPPPPMQEPSQSHDELKRAEAGKVEMVLEEL